MASGTVTEVVDQLLAAEPQAREHQDELMAVLEVSRQARDALGVQASYALTSGVGELGTPLVATVTVAVLEGALVGEPGESGVEALRKTLGSETLEQTSFVELPTGTAARGEAMDEIRLIDDGLAMLVLSVRYLLAVPNTTRPVLVCFASPMVAVADDWTQLFESMANTLEFV